MVLEISHFGKCIAVPQTSARDGIVCDMKTNSFERGFVLAKAPFGPRVRLL